MYLRRALVLVVAAAAFAATGAGYRTPNFVVEAATPEVAQQVGQYAEHYRREKALQWLGYEMPPWPEPCPLRVSVTMGGSGGATSFAFDRGRILSQKMQIEGSLDRLLASVLPHEVTHTVFAHHFRQPVPRWADEGGSVLSEDDLERSRHDQLVRQILNTPGRAIPLRRLFQLRDYPGDVMVLYAEGYSVANFLVGQSSRPAFLNFVAQGVNERDWDRAVRAHYRYNSVEDLERAWIEHLRNTRQGAPAVLAATNPGAAGGAAVAGTDPGRMLMRQTILPAQPHGETSGPVVRGQMPDDDGWSNPRGPAVRPGFLPEQVPSGAVRVPKDQWRPARPDGAVPSGARLGMPQWDAPSIPGPVPTPPVRPILPGR